MYHIPSSTMYLAFILILYSLELYILFLGKFISITTATIFYGCPVHHYLPGFTQMHVHWVGDAIYFILCCPLLFLLSIFSSIRVFYNDLGLLIRWKKYWSFSFSVSPSNEYLESLPKSSKIPKSSKKGGGGGGGRSEIKKEKILFFFVGAMRFSYLRRKMSRGET